MAALTGDQFAVVFQDGVCDRMALVALKNVTAGDTVDLSGTFRVIKRTGIVSATGTTIAAATATGAVITIPAGPNADGVWLLAVGVAA